jgi:hypothetical protein
MADQDFCRRCDRTCSVHWQVDPVLEERVLRSTKFTSSTLCLECFTAIAKQIRVSLELSDFHELRFSEKPKVGVPL